MLGIDLENVFRSPGQIAVLRTLWKAPTALTGRQVQQLAGVCNRTAMQCLEDLERLGLLRRRTVGRAYLYSLKRTHRVVRDWVSPIFRAEQGAPERLRKTLAKLLKDHCLSAVLYGSVARGEAEPTSDVDLLVVVPNKEAGESFAQKAQTKVEQSVRDGWGAMLEVNVKTADELFEKWESRLIKRIRREGQLVAGDPLEVVQRGRRS